LRFLKKKLENLVKFALEKQSFPKISTQFLGGNSPTKTLVLSSVLVFFFLGGFLPKRSIFARFRFFFLKIEIFVRF
jgi:hypothetical protein